MGPYDRWRADVKPGVIMSLTFVSVDLQSVYARTLVVVLCEMLVPIIIAITSCINGVVLTATLFLDVFALLCCSWHHLICSFYIYCRFPHPYCFLSFVGVDISLASRGVLFSVSYAPPVYTCISDVGSCSANIWLSRSSGYEMQVELYLCSASPISMHHSIILSAYPLDWSPSFRLASALCISALLVVFDYPPRCIQLCTIFHFIEFASSLSLVSPHPPIVIGVYIKARGNPLLRNP